MTKSKGLPPKSKFPAYNSLEHAINSYYIANKSLRHDPQIIAQTLSVLRAKADGDNILVSGAEPLTLINVCDLLGRVIKTVRADATGYAKIETAPHGVVIVTNASGKAKLNVK